jgi:hypothetical protein
MNYQIDQSGKIEDTKKLTVVAYANGSIKTLKISAVEKRKLITILRVQDYPQKAFIYKAFAGLIFLLLKDEQVDNVQIDKEYPGNENIIKIILFQLFDKTNKKRPEVSFTLIGKNSPAHKAAIATFRGQRKPDLIIKAVDLLRLFYE